MIKNFVFLSKIIFYNSFKELLKLENDESLPKEQKPLFKLDIYNNMFTNMIEETVVFKEILSRIKFEYDEYLFSLLRNQQHANHLDETNINKINSEEKGRIEELDKDIKSLLDQIEKFKVLNVDLEEKIKLETSNLKTLKANQEQLLSSSMFVGSTLQINEVESKNEEDSISDILKPTETLENKINAVKNKIIESMEKINSINQKLKKEFVPYVVINNLNQSIKDVEVI
jgi:hypothetical protein